MGSSSETEARREERGERRGGSSCGRRPSGGFPFVVSIGAGGIWGRRDEMSTAGGQQCAFGLGQ